MVSIKKTKKPMSKITQVPQGRCYMLLNCEFLSITRISLVTKKGLTSKNDKQGNSMEIREESQFRVP